MSNSMPNFRKILRAVTWEKLLLLPTNQPTIRSLTSTDVENCNVVNDGLNVRKQKDNQEIKKNEKSKQMLTNKKRTNKQ